MNCQCIKVSCVVCIRGCLDSNIEVEGLCCLRILNSRGVVFCVVECLCIIEGAVLCCVCVLCRGPPSGGLAPYTDLCLDTAYTLAYTLSVTNRKHTFY